MTTTMDAPAARRSELLARWRIDIRWRSYGVISFQADGCLANRELAAYLGVDMRALHAVLRDDPHFQVEIRWNQALRRGEPWWRINATLKAPAKPELPRLVSTSVARVPRIAARPG